MAGHSSVLAWRIPGMGSLVAAVYGVAQSRTWLKRLSSSSSPFTEQAKGVNLELRATTLISILLPPQWRRQLSLCLTKTAALLTREQLSTFLKLRCSSKSHVSVDSYIFVVVQSLSHLRLCDPMNCSTPGSSGLRYLLSLLEFMSVESVMLSNHLILCRSLLLLPSIFSLPPPVDHSLSELFFMTHLS